MTYPRLLLGIDAGQTMVKAALFTAHGLEVAVSSASTATTTPRDRWQERDMDLLWGHVARAVRDCLASAGVDGSAVVGVGVCGHNDGLHLVDESGKPVRPAVLATDSRAQQQADEVRRGPRAGDVLATTGQLPFSASPAALLAWLREAEPAVLARTRWVLFCKDWIRLRLTGEVATDPSDASASFTDVRTQQWSEEALAMLGLPEVRPLLPPLRGSAELAGVLTAEAADETGLAPGAPVVTGAHDVDAAALGIGAASPGAASVVLGTFSINQIVADRPEMDPRWQARSFLRPGQWLHMSTSPTSASNLEWAVRRFGPVTSAGDPDFPAAVAEAAVRPPLPDDPTYLPFLYGSPYGSAVAGTLVGLRGWHGRGDVHRAILEGVVLTHRLHLDVLRERFSVVGAVRVCGGGAQSAYWTQLLADAIDLPIEVTDARQAGARGAALLAAVGAGIHADLDAAVAAAVRVVRRQHPRPDVARRLDARYDRFHSVVAALRPLYDQG